MPKVIRALEVMEKGLSDGRPFIVGEEVTMADYFLLPTLFAFSLTPEGKQTLPRFPAIVAWDNRMDTRPDVVRFNTKLPPRAPIYYAA
jgi:glutathione S-transferase